MDRNGKVTIQKSCLYCAAPLPKGRRKYCSDRCSLSYFQEKIKPFWWNRAKATALRRAGDRCEDCSSRDHLEVHHLVPLAPGEARWNSPKKVQSNLIVLCRRHHNQTHHPPRSRWALIQLAEQGTMYLEVSGHGAVAGYQPWLERPQPAARTLPTTREPGSRWR